MGNCAKLCHQTLTEMSPLTNEQNHNAHENTRKCEAALLQTVSYYYERWSFCIKTLNEFFIHFHLLVAINIYAKNLSYLEIISSTFAETPF